MTSCSGFTGSGPRGCYGKAAQYPGCYAGVMQGAGEDSLRYTVSFQGNILTSEKVLAQAAAAFFRHNSTSIGLGDRLMAVSVGATCVLAPLACCRVPLVLARTASHGSSHVLCCHRLCRRACTYAGAARGRGQRPG